VREDFLANPLVAIAPENHALTGKVSIGVEELAKNNLILREPGSGTRMAIDRFFDQSRIKPRVRLELGSNEAIKQAVAGGLGLSILSRHALSPDPSTEGLAILDSVGFPILSNWYIVHLTGKRLSPIATVFKNHLQATAARLSPTA
jgi:DNA-binding transcriptional LysR family regulator